MGRETFRDKILATNIESDDSSRDYLFNKFVDSIATQPDADYKQTFSPDEQRTLGELYLEEAKALLDLASPPELGLRLNMSSLDFENLGADYPDAITKTVDGDMYPGKTVYSLNPYEDLQIDYIFEHESETAQSIVVTYKGIN